MAVVQRDLQERHAFVVADDMVRRASLGEGRGDTVRRRSRNGGPATRAAPADQVEGTLRELRGFDLVRAAVVERASMRLDEERRAERHERDGERDGDTKRSRT